MYLRARYYDPEISRFINVNLMRDGLNWYGYAGGNPVMYHDPSGYVLETILDVVGLGFSIYDMVTEPSWMNAAFLAWDVIGILVPFVPGSYVGKGGKAMKAISKVASKVDDAVDVGKVVVKKVAKGIAKGLSKADDVGGLVKGTIELESKTGLLGKAAETVSTMLKVNDVREDALTLYEGISGGDEKKLYRAVGPEELDDIMDYQGVRGRADGRSYEAKQFGNDFDEILDLANQPIMRDTAAIVEITIPKDTYDQLNHMPLDVGILKSGAVTVEPEMLKSFNDSIINIEHVY